MSDPEVISYNEQYARQIESELAATPRLTWIGAALTLAGAACAAVGYFQDVALLFLAALALLLFAMLPIAMALGNAMWGASMQADADRARESERRLAAREAALREREKANGFDRRDPAS